MLLASSPCVKLCVLHETTGVCLGCGRTLVEIGRWSAMSEAQRLVIMARLAARQRPSQRRMKRGDAARTTAVQP